MITIRQKHRFIIPDIRLSIICLKLYRLFLPTLLKNLPIILILFPYHYLVFRFYSFSLWYCVLTSRETWTWCIFCCIAIVYMSVMYYTSKIVNESHPCLSLNWHISHVTVYHWFSYVSNSKQLFLHHTCECPIIPRIMFAITVTYNSGNYVGTLGLRPTQAYQCNKHYRR